MGLFDVFKKKECCICGNEVGLLGNRKLADGNMCAKCTRKLSPWFEDRRESTMAQIKEQLAYREQNARELEHFQITRTVGEANKMYIEEVNGVPTRFFVTDASDYLEANPDILSFRDVVSCVTDIDVRDEEIKQKDEEGRLVSYDPPRFKHHHNFYIKMQIRNNPYFDDIRFYVNSGVVTLESIGGIGGVGGFFGSAQRNTFGSSITGNSYTNTREQRRYSEYRQMCRIIEQAVEDGKRGTGDSGRISGADPVQLLLEQLRSAPDEETITRLHCTITMMIQNAPDQEALRDQLVNALKDARMRLDWENYSSPGEESSTKTKFCSSCGAPWEGGKFCQSCGSRLA